jgi:hypothetical protein
MKYTILLACFLLQSAVYGQKMFETGEWCAHNKASSPIPMVNITDSRSDSIDLTHAFITLDLTQASSNTISGNCKWVFQPKMDNVPQMRLDLLALTVDSVILNNQATTFQRSGSSLLIPLTPAPAGTIQDVHVYYRGTPQKDASGWGGFYFSGNYAFNLGVGFAADPHVFGRAWFPCFDNFEERNTYTFDIYSNPNQPAYCNGYILTDETTNGKRRRLWLMNQPIPSYLACVAIGPYTSFTRTYPGVNNPIPVEIAAPAADTVKVRNTFVNLPKAIEVYEDWFGPYKWHKIGYSIVPFQSGAMEHATNVAIGNVFIDGSLNYETLWAHELSHHWWGDLATCTTAEDMWLNEGMASYCEHLFTEKVYGKAAYRTAVRTNFLTVLQNTHLNEGGYRAVSGIPHDLTYGSHVYNKGAVVGHNLRGYLGDDLFRQGMRYAMENTSFKDWSSADFRDLIHVATGKDMTAFFDNWVFSGGFTDFLIDSSRVISSAGGGFDVQLFVKQKLRGAPDFYREVPLEFTFLDAQYGRVHRMASVSGETPVVTFNLDFEPSFIFVNTNLQLTLARGDGEKMFKAAGAQNFPDAKWNVTVNSMGADSALLRIEHHYATPDNAGANAGQFVLTNRFWEVFGDFPAGFDAQATLIYDGRGQLDELDTELFAATGPSEDSLVVLYRPGAGHQWQIWPDQTRLTLGSPADKFGQLRIRGIQAGQYTLGKGAAASATVTPASNPIKVMASPNPATDKVRIQSNTPFGQVQVLGVDGVLYGQYAVANATTFDVSLAAFPAGQYWLVVSDKEHAAAITVVKIP